MVNVKMTVIVSVRKNNNTKIHEKYIYKYMKKNVATEHETGFL